MLHQKVFQRSKEGGLTSGSGDSLSEEIPVASTSRRPKKRSKRMLTFLDRPLCKRCVSSDDRHVLKEIQKSNQLLPPAPYNNSLFSFFECPCLECPLPTTAARRFVKHSVALLPAPYNNSLFPFSSVPCPPPLLGAL